MWKRETDIRGAIALVQLILPAAYKSSIIEKLIFLGISKNVATPTL
jgi:hypothetical protein